MLVINKKSIGVIFSIVALLFFSIPVWAIYQSSSIGNRSGISGTCSDSGTTEWFCDHSDCSGGGGFESPWTPTSNVGNWSAFYGTPVIESTIVAKGSVSMEVAAQGDYMRVDITGDSRSEIWMDFWVYPDTLAGSFKAFNEHSDTTKSYVIANSATGFRWFDGSSNYGSGVSCTVDTWQHLFVHIDMGAGDGSETVQLAVNNQDTWDSWDYSATNLSLVDTVIDDILDFGTPYNSAPDQVYFDDFRIFYGTDMPCEWQ